MTIPSFELDSYVDRRGREWPVRVRYSFGGIGYPLIAWTSLDLSPVEFAVVNDEIAAVCDDDYDDWMADQDGPRAAESYVPELLL